MHFSKIQNHLPLRESTEHCSVSDLIDEERLFTIQVVVKRNMGENPIVGAANGYHLSSKHLVVER